MDRGSQIRVCTLASFNVPSRILPVGPRTAELLSTANPGRFTYVTPSPGFNLDRHLVRINVTPETLQLLELVLGNESPVEEEDRTSDKTRGN